MSGGGDEWRVGGRNEWRVGSEYNYMVFVERDDWEVLRILWRKGRREGRPGLGERCRVGVSQLRCMYQKVEVCG